MKNRETTTKNRPATRSVVKTGGIAKEAADAEDVTRDTYGETQAQRGSTSRDTRIANAERTAEAAGIPGIVLPDPHQAGQAAEETFRRTQISGDRVASRYDAAKAAKKRRK